MKNVLVGQSGGPTAVINSSLAGVYETAKACGAPHVYGMQYGIEGVLEGKLIELDGVRLSSSMSMALFNLSSSTQMRRSNRPATPCIMPYTLPAPRRLQLS